VFVHVLYQVLQEKQGHFQHLVFLVKIQSDYSGVNVTVNFLSFVGTNV
jgi:hypothetical protein